MPQGIKKDSLKTRKFLKELSGYLIAVVSAIILATIIRLLIFEPFIVPTPSMDPTLKVGDKVIINKVSYKIGEVERSDIIAFHSPIEEGKDLVKRVIAIEGDLVALASDGQIFVNDEKIMEDYLPLNQSFSYENQEIMVGKNQVFVMGDNRDDSFDSRYFGVIDEDLIFGELLMIYWPPSRW